MLADDDAAIAAPAGWTGLVNGQRLADSDASFADHGQTAELGTARGRVSP